MRRHDDVGRKATVHVRADRSSLRTEIRPTGGAMDAAPAGVEIGLADDAVSVRPTLDARAESRDARADLVAECHRRRRDVLAEVDVKVGAADAGVVDLEQQL